MSWFKASIRSGLQGLLGGHSPTPSESVLESGTEDIREAMLGLLGDAGRHQFPQVTRRLRYAVDVQSLWYLRGELMAALAALHGEAAARREVLGITQMFRGLVPGSLHSRPSPLS